MNKAYWLHAAILGSMTTLPSNALAQNSDPAGTDNPNEIVVTAQNRTERLQEVPIQVSALNSEAIGDAGIKSTADALSQIANASFDRGNNYRSNYITMRGLTQLNNADPPVAFVVDGVPQTNQESIGVALFDVERIEILKGPQGSLYGRNAVGGAINVITKEPTNDLSGFWNLAVSKGETVDASAGVSGAIVDDVLLFRVAATYKHSDGLIRNSFRGDHSDYIDHDYTFRGRLIAKPSDALKIDLRAEYNKYAAGGNYYSAVFSGDPNDFVDPQANLPGLTSGSVTDLTAKIDYDLDFATLTSISNYSDFKLSARSDGDIRNPVTSPGGFFGLGFQLGQGQDLKRRIFSQEVRLVSRSDQPLRWLVGGYYLDTDRSLRSRFFFDFNGQPSQIDSPANLFLDNNEGNDNRAYAFFGQVDYDILTNLTLTGGLRYDNDRRVQTNLNSNTVRKARFDRLQPKVTLAWKPGDNKLIYATFGTGFRSGGFNAPNAPVPVFASETLSNYEAGFKTQFLDRRLTVNGAAFQTDVKNYQFFYLDTASGAQIIDTIGKVRIRGLELELIASLADRLEASVAVGVIDSNIRNSVFAADIGNRAPRTVPFSTTSSLQYKPSLGGDVEGLARVEWQHFGKKYWGADNVAVQNPYDIVNARLGVNFGQFGVYGFVRNLLNDKYYGEFFQPKYSGLDIFIGYPGAPRSFGVEMKMSF